MEALLGNGADVQLKGGKTLKATLASYMLPLVTV